MNENAPSIMVVDDTKANLDLLCGMLRDAGYRVRPSPNGELALRSARHLPPDLVLLDINMPGIDGYEVCRQLKDDADLRDVPVIFISALTGTDEKVRGFKTGGVDYISKPFQVDEVLARVKTHLALRAVNEDLRQAMDELKRAQGQLIQSEKMASLGVLTAGIAHELNNPINFVSSGIRGLNKLLAHVKQVAVCCDSLTVDNAPRTVPELKALKEEVGFSEVLRGIDELAAGIETGVKRASDIVHGLRIFSRLDEDQRKPADLHENIDSALIMLGNELSGEITVRKEYGVTPQILCFPGKLNQAILNILKNGIDAIKEAGEGDHEIRISTQTVEADGKKWVTVEIADTGCGIAPEVREHLFEPFFTTKQVGHGVGLGLSITHGIVEDHAGRIDVESEPGRGATFRIWLPVIVEE